MSASSAVEPLSKSEVLLIDLSSLYWSSWHATKDASVSEAASLTATAVQRCVGNANGTTLVAICCDMGRSFRKDLAPEYKANRPEKDQAALAELERLKERLRRDGFLLWGAAGFEADDVIATAAHAASKAGHPVRIASADKDLMQLLALPDSCALRTHNWRTWRAADVVTELGIEPEGLRDWLALVGDTSDNIKGCPSVGPKTATALLKEHFDLDTLYARIDELGAETMTPRAKKIATPAVLEKLKAHKADVMLARQLVTLRTDAPIKFAEIYERREPVTTIGAKEMDMDDDEGISRGPGAAPKEEPAPKDSASPATATTSSASAGDAASAATTAPQTVLAAVPNDPPAQPHTALVVTYERALEPRSSGQAMAMAQIMYESRAFVRFPTPGALCMAIVGGRELGLGAVASTNAFWFIPELGCLALKAHTIAELAMRHPKCEYLRLIHSDKDYAEYETKHRDHPEPFRHRFTVEDAINAGRCTREIVQRKSMQEKDNRSQWDKDRPGMLRKTAVTQIVRIVYPGCAGGFYSLEELTGGGEA